MRAALFERMGELPSVHDVADPRAEVGEVVVDVVAAPVLPYHAEVFSGRRPMLFELPFVPGTGAVGRIRSLGPGATELAPGAWVYCDPTLRGRDAQGLPAIALQGLTAGGPAALPLQRAYGHGSWAERLRLPLENVVPIGDIDAADASRWLSLGTMLVPYGGLDSVGLKAGETVVINGATGSFGSAGVAMALALGAARVVATGRNRAALAAISDRYGWRVRPAAMTGDEAADRATIISAAGRPIDVVLDILPPAASTAQVLAALRSVRPGGRVSLMGGVGLAGGGELALPYAWIMRNNITVKGQWMYPREAISLLVALAASDVIDLDHQTVAEFTLRAVSDAIRHAAASQGPFARTVLRI